MDENLRSNQILVDITREDGSKGKISYFNSPHHQNKTKNSNTAKSEIFRGVFENKIFVCVRRFVKAQISNTSEGKLQFQRDIDALKEPQHLHENFIRYLCNEQDTDFFYVAIEWCICSVEDLYCRNANNKNWAKEKIESGIIKKSLGKKELLRQATEGLAFLHALGFVHRNLKPSNFLIAQLQQYRGFRYLVKLSDFRLSKDPVECPNDSGTIGSNGWTYPKKLDYFSGDVFILGCFFHYVLTDGEHPFGDLEYNREENIKKENYCVYRPDWTINPKIDDPNAVVLLKKMIRFNLKDDKCTLEDVFKSSYFSPINFYKLYDLPDVKPGLCVIFNQEIFDDTRNNRIGSDQDEDSLKYVFLEFGFDVRLYKDLKAEVLYCCINELAREDFSSYASLVVCILSHGNEDVVEGVDGKNIKINELKYKFNSNDCPTLNGKPKIWIIEACQGKEIQNPMQPNGSQRSGAYSKPDNSENNVSQEVPNECLIPNKRQKENPTSSCKSKNSSEDKLNQRPPLMDFLDIRASIPGYTSFRNPDYGSYLILYLCRELMTEYASTNHDTKDLVDVLLKVQSHIISLKIRTLGPDKDEIEAKQTIEWRVCLSDKIAFKKAKKRGVEKTILIPELKPTETEDWLTTIASTLNTFLTF